jgi:hypothetical protein
LRPRALPPECDRRRGVTPSSFESRSGSIRTRGPCRVLIGSTSCAIYGTHRVATRTRQLIVCRRLRASSSVAYACLKIVVSRVRVRVSPFFLAGCGGEEAIRRRLDRLGVDVAPAGIRSRSAWTTLDAFGGSRPARGVQARAAMPFASNAIPNASASTATILDALLVRRSWKRLTRSAVLSGEIA